MVRAPPPSVHASRIVSSRTSAAPPRFVAVHAADHQHAAGLLPAAGTPRWGRHARSAPRRHAAERCRGGQSESRPAPGDEQRRGTRRAQPCPDPAIFRLERRWLDGSRRGVEAASLELSAGDAGLLRLIAITTGLFARAGRHNVRSRTFALHCRLPQRWVTLTTLATMDEADVARCRFGETERRLVAGMVCESSKRTSQSTDGWIDAPKPSFRRRIAQRPRCSRT